MCHSIKRRETSDTGGDSQAAEHLSVPTWGTNASAVAGSERVSVSYGRIVEEFGRTMKTASRSVSGSSSRSGCT